MKIISIFLAITLAFFIVAYFCTSTYPMEPCPHPNFLARHLCTHCNSLDDAADFSKYRPMPTGRNTVFLGHPRFEIKTYMKDRCGNVDAVRVAVCTRTGHTDVPYTCNWLGERCYGEHSLSSGHLFYNGIKCF